VSTHELFHEIVGEANVRVRREIVARGLKDRIDFRNVHYPPHRDGLAALGGSRTPALWDGVRLHEGEEAVLRALRDIIPAQ
jgi:hypothetical protein